MKSVVAHDAVVTEAVPGVHRVEVDGDTVGYVLETGAVFVSGSRHGGASRRHRLTGPH
jgi:hypothetical protein